MVGLNDHGLQQHLITVTAHKKYSDNGGYNYYLVQLKGIFVLLTIVLSAQRTSTCTHRDSRQQEW